MGGKGSWILVGTIIPTKNNDHTIDATIHSNVFLDHYLVTEEDSNKYCFPIG